GGRAGRGPQCGRDLQRTRAGTTAGAADGLFRAAVRGAPRLAARPAPGPGMAAAAVVADAGACRAARTPARRPVRIVRAATGRFGDPGATHAAAGTRCAASRTAVDRGRQPYGVAARAFATLNALRACGDGRAQPSSRHAAAG